MRTADSAMRTCRVAIAGRLLSLAIVSFIVLGAAPGVAFAGSAGSGVQTALSPTGQSISPWTDFSVDVNVTQPSQQYAGWDGTLVYDPSLITYVSGEQGCLMTGACSGACGASMLGIFPGADTLYID